MLDAGSTSKQLAQPTNEVACHASPLASGRRLLMSRQSFVVLTETSSLRLFSGVFFVGPS